MDNFGQRLKKLRKSKGLTQTDLANILHLSDKSSISRYERNHNNPPIDVIKKMSEVLDVSVNYLLKGIENESNSKLQNINENEMIKIPIILNLCAIFSIVITTADQSAYCQLIIAV